MTALLNASPIIEIPMSWIMRLVVHTHDQSPHSSGSRVASSMACAWSVIAAYTNEMNGTNATPKTGPYVRRIVPKLGMDTDKKYYVSGRAIDSACVT